LFVIGGRVIDRSFLSRLGEIHPLFSGLPSSLADEILHKSKLISLARGERARRANVAQSYPLVLKGGVHVSLTGSGGREIVLYRLKPGDGCPLPTARSFLEVSADISYIAQTDAELLLLPFATYRRLFDENETFRDYTLTTLSNRFLSLASLIERISFERLDQRLAALLLAADTSGPIRASHLELAQQLGSTREHVTRLLRVFTAAGAVVVKRQNIQLTDRAHLTRVASGAPG
jgi:CRP/FNR family transcriptional regulator, anaerobic regulatory protein